MTRPTPTALYLQKSASDQEPIKSSARKLTGAPQSDPPKTEFLEEASQSMLARARALVCVATPVLGERIYRCNQSQRFDRLRP
ncbi:MAG: hypothetical protein OHK005_17600 [Candidatus Methylacidiphilales bacterium]